MQVNKKKFIDVANLLAEEIRYMQVGDKLPSTNELTKRFSITIVTASNALKELQSRGLIMSKPGNGSVVMSPTQCKFIICVEPQNILQEFNQHWWLFWNSLNKSCCYDFQHYSLLTISNENLKNEIESLLNRSQQIGGVIFFREIGDYNDNLKLLKKYQIPSIFFGSSTYSSYINDNLACLYNEEEIVNLALSHLYENGHRKIGCLYHSTHCLDKTRLDLYYNFLKQNNLDNNFVLDIASENNNFFDKVISSSDKRRAFRNYISNISALLLLHDNQALSLFQCLNYLGIKIPDDLSIVSIDNLPICKELRPQLDSVSINVYDNAKMCLKLLENNNNNFYKVPVSLKIRNSVKNI